MKTLKNLNLKGKTVLLRADINSDVVNGKLIESERIKETSLTIKLLKKKKARIIVIAHQGNKGKDDFVSLKEHARFLNKYTRIDFVHDTIGKDALLSILKLKDGEALLLENIRFLTDEFKPEKKDNKIIKALAPIVDLFVNDAFSVCHRKQTSIISFPKHVPSVPGLLVEKELKALKKISMKNALYILGGAKPESNIKLLRGNNILACGLFGQTCLRAYGINLGYQNKYLKKSTLVKESYKGFLTKLKRKLKNVVTPVDFAVNINGKRKEFPLSEFPLKYQIDDIGEKTIQNFVKKIKSAKSIYMKGPAGFTGDKNFAHGTNEILKSIAKSKAYSLIGGGHLSDAINRSKIPKNRFNHISLSGGALLSYIAGEKLPGLQALGYYKK